MSTYRVNKRENPYAQIDRGLLNNPNLSWKAKGILAYLLSKHDDWQVYITQLVKASKDGRAATASGIQELIDARYIVRARVRAEDGTFSGYAYDVFEEPQPPSGDDGPEGTNPDNGPSEGGETENGFSENGFSENGFSENGFSENGFSENGFSATTNRDGTKKDLTEKENIPSDSAAGPDPASPAGAGSPPDGDWDGGTDHTPERASQSHDEQQPDPASPSKPKKRAKQAGRTKDWAGTWQHAYAEKAYRRLGEAGVLLKTHRDDPERFINEWAYVFDLLHRKDGHAKEDIVTVMRWLFAPGNWWIEHGNFCAVSKLREKRKSGGTLFEEMLLSARREKRPASSGDGVPYQFGNHIIIPGFGAVTPAV